MTVPSEVSKSGPYNCNGVTTVFNYGFRILSDEHIRVVLTTAAGVESDLVLTTHYTVSGVGNVNGSIALTAAGLLLAVTGTTITNVRSVPFTQEVDLQNQGAYYAETVEGALDLLTMEIQQVKELSDRSIAVPISNEDVTADELVGMILAVPGHAADAETAAAAAQAWAVNPEDDPVSVEAGGDGASTFSAFHWAAKAEDAYTALATGVVPFGPFSGDGEETDFTLPIAPIVSGNCAVFIDGVFQDYQARSIAGTTLTFTEPPPIGTTISGIIFAPVDDLAAPPAASVSAPAIDTGDAANIRTALSIYSKAETDTLIKGVKGSNIASAATIDLGAATGDFVDITGTAAISNFGTAAAGVERTVRFTGGATLTHSASLLLFSGFTGLNWVVPSNAVMRFRSLGGGIWVETSQTPTQGSAAPTIEFGGASTGVTYAGGNTGRWVRHGKMMTWRGRLFLLTKGSSTGNAVIRSFPAPVANLVSDSVLISNFSGLASLTGAPSGVRAAVTDGISLQQSGAAATANLTDANFTNSSSIFFILIYEGT